MLYGACSVQLLHSVRASRAGSFPYPEYVLQAASGQLQQQAISTTAVVSTCGCLSTAAASRVSACVAGSVTPCCSAFVQAHFGICLCADSFTILLSLLCLSFLYLLPHQQQRQHPQQPVRPQDATVKAALHCVFRRACLDLAAEAQQKGQAPLQYVPAKGSQPALQRLLQVALLACNLGLSDAGQNGVHGGLSCSI